MTTSTELQALLNNGSITQSGSDVIISCKILLGKNWSLSDPIETVLYLLLYRYFQLNPETSNVTFDFPKFINNQLKVESIASIRVVLSEGITTVNTNPPNPPNPGNFDLTNLGVYLGNDNQLNRVEATNGGTYILDMDLDSTFFIYLENQTTTEVTGTIASSSGTINLVNGEFTLLAAIDNGGILTTNDLPITLTFTLNIAQSTAIEITIDGSVFEFNLNLNAYVPPVSTATLLVAPTTQTLGNGNQFTLNWEIIDETGEQYNWAIVESGGGFLNGSIAISNLIDSAMIDVDTTFINIGFYDVRIFGDTSGILAEQSIEVQ